VTLTRLFIKKSKCTPTDLKKLFFHITYHNRGPTTHDMQHHFEIIQRFGEATICAIKNSRKCSINPKLIVSYHQTKNLGNLLSPQKLGMELEAELTDPDLHSLPPDFLTQNLNFSYSYTLDKFTSRNKIFNKACTRQITPERNN